MTAATPPLILLYTLRFSSRTEPTESTDVESDLLEQYDVGSPTMASSHLRAETLVTAQSLRMDASVVAEPLVCGPCWVAQEDSFHLAKGWQSQRQRQ